jgi:hypothetical protein
MHKTYRISHLEKLEDNHSEWEALTEDEKLFRVIYRNHVLTVLVNNTQVFTKKLDHEFPNHISWENASKHLRVQIL